MKLIPGVCEADRGVWAYSLNLVLHSLDHRCKLGTGQLLAVDMFGADRDAEDLAGVIFEAFYDGVSFFLEDVSFAGRPDSNDRLGVGALERREQRLKCVALGGRIDTDNRGSRLGFNGLEVGGEVVSCLAGVFLRRGEVSDCRERPNLYFNAEQSET